MTKPLSNYNNNPQSNTEHSMNPTDTPHELPRLFSCCELLEDDHEQPIELISGVLRRGDCLCLTGPPKCGKSLALVQLACAMAAGQSEWFGRPVRHGKVLLVNGETDAYALANRIHCVAMLMGCSAGALSENLAIWNVRGEDVTPDMLIALVKDRAFDCIIVDPIYKLFGRRKRGLEQLSHELNSALVYSEAFSRPKRASRWERSPDVVVSLTRLKKQPGRLRVEWTLRQFAAIAPQTVELRYPLFQIVESPSSVPVRQQLKPETVAEAFYQQQAKVGLRPVTVTELAAQLGVSRPTIISKLQQAGLEVQHGKVYASR